MPPLEGHSHEIGSEGFFSSFFFIILHFKLLELSKLTFLHASTIRSTMSKISLLIFPFFFFIIIAKKNRKEKKKSQVDTSNEFINSRCINRSWDFDETLLDAISVNCFLYFVVSCFLRYYWAFYYFFFHHSRMKSHAWYVSASTVSRVNSAIWDWLIANQPFAFLFLFCWWCITICLAMPRNDEVFFLNNIFQLFIFLSLLAPSSFLPLKHLLEQQQEEMCQGALWNISRKHVDRRHDSHVNAVAEIFKLKKTNVVIQHPRRYAPNSKHQLISSSFFARTHKKKSAAEISLCVVSSSSL